jgi:phytoene dehydrogenase-like protein
MEFLDRRTARVNGAYDAIAVGSGPNGLAAAVRLASAGRQVLVVEGRDTIGGGCRSAELTLPGFVHDVCSAVHPLAVASPFLSTLPLADHGLRWIQPTIPLAHALDGGQAAVLSRSVDETAAGLGPDADAYRRLMRPLVDGWSDLVEQVLSPIRVPRRPTMLARFGLAGLMPADRYALSRFKGDTARALFAGLAAHSIRPLGKPVTTAFGLMLGAAAHAVGWPVAEGGAQRIVDALAGHLRALGGSVKTGQIVNSVDDLPAARAVLFDVAPGELDRIAGHRFPSWYRRTLQGFRHGAGVFKLDLALDGSIPWSAKACSRAGTVHVGGTLEEIVAGEAQVGEGRPPERPFVLVAQQSLFDPSRAPEGRHTVWAYCHVPAGSAADMTERVLGQIERFAPGFRDRILATSVMGPDDLQRYNPNNVGGDIAGGAHEGLRILAGPALRTGPYGTPDERLFLCSASTPPGPGVHGMCGFHAAGSALRHALSG